MGMDAQMGTLRTGDVDDGGRPIHSGHHRHLPERAPRLRYQHGIRSLPAFCHAAWKGKQDATRQRPLPRKGICADWNLRRRRLRRQLREPCTRVLHRRPCTELSGRGTRKESRCQALPRTKSALQEILLEGRRHAETAHAGRLVPHSLQPERRCRLLQRTRIPRGQRMELYLLRATRHLRTGTADGWQQSVCQQTATRVRRGTIRPCQRTRHRLPIPLQLLQGRRMAHTEDCRRTA